MRNEEENQADRRRAPLHRKSFLSKMTDGYPLAGSDLTQQDRKKRPSLKNIHWLRIRSMECVKPLKKGENTSHVET